MMRLARIEFTNFRCFRSETLELDDFTALVGPNNCGKSTALRALNIFFGEGTKSSSIQADDFYVGCNDNDELKLRFEFDGVEGEAADQLSHYVRGKRVVFEIVASRDEVGAITSRCRGVRYGLAEFAPFFAASGAAGRRPEYEKLQETYNLPKWRNLEKAEEEVRDLEASYTHLHVPIPSEENAYGVAGPLPKLRKFIDWIYVPAVKDASSEATELRESAFSKLISFSVRSRCNFADDINRIRLEATNSLSKVLSDTSHILKGVGAEIDKEFKELSTSSIDIAVDWGAIENIVVKEPVIKSIFKDGAVQGSPDAFGHGLQRTYLMALLSLAAKVQKAEDGFQLILGVEEPELYQHPPQARFLADALANLSSKNVQIVVTTHSPAFIGGRVFDNIRVLRKSGNKTKIHSWSIDEQRSYCAARLGQDAIGAAAALSGIDRALQTNIAEMFFAAKIVFVEGPEDVALLEAYLRAIGKLGPFLRAGGHFVPVGGKTKLPMLIALARGFYIDQFTVFDLDLNQPPAKRANNLIISYAKEAGDEIKEEDLIFGGNHFFAWPHNIQKSISDECPQWLERMNAIAVDWGWSLGRMQKDPMLLNEAITQLHADGIEIPALKLLVERLESFWSR